MVGSLFDNWETLEIYLTRAISVLCVQNFSNVLVLVSYQFPFLSARVIPLVRKELAKFE